MIQSAKDKLDVGKPFDRALLRGVAEEIVLTLLLDKKAGAAYCEMPARLWETWVPATFAGYPEGDTREYLL